MCRQAGTLPLQGTTACPESFLLKLLAKAFSERDFPAARADAEQLEAHTGRLTGASCHHLPAQLLHAQHICGATLWQDKNIHKALTPFLSQHYLHLPSHPSWDRQVDGPTVWEISLPNEWK